MVLRTEISLLRRLQGSKNHLYGGDILCYIAGQRILERERADRSERDEPHDSANHHTKIATSEALKNDNR